MKESRALNLLERISEIPTAPLFEQHILSEIESILEELFPENPRITVSRDGFHNLVLRYEGDKNKECPKTMAFLVHTDHPGFEIVGIEKDHLIAKKAGGNAVLISEGTEVDLHSLAKPFMGKGTIEKITEPYHIRVGQEANYEFATLAVGGFEIEKNQLKAPVLDDYVGIATTITALEAISREGINVNVQVLFHRAEEISLLGAYVTAMHGLVPRDALVYSIDTVSHITQDPNDYNRTIEIAKPGQGCALLRRNILVGAYDLDAVCLGVNAEPNVKLLNTQGGFTEADIYLAMGYRVTGVAIPLMGAHNNGRPEGRPGAVKEAAAIEDIEACTRLLVRLARALEKNPELYKKHETRANTKRENEVIKRAESMYHALEGGGRARFLP